MTNAEKYLKDGVSGIKPLLDKCREIGAIDSGREYRIDQMLREQAKPTLTEDERVILRNIQKGLFREGFISRTAGNELFVFIKETGETIELYIFNHLFQFIKERRRIRNKRIVRR